MIGHFSRGKYCYSVEMQGLHVRDDILSWSHKNATHQQFLFPAGKLPWQGLGAILILGDYPVIKPQQRIS